MGQTAEDEYTSNKFPPSPAFEEHRRYKPPIAISSKNATRFQRARDRTGNVELAESIMRFDEAGREYESQREVFAAAGMTLPSARGVTHTGGGLAANSTANDHTGKTTIVSSDTSTGNRTYVLTRTVYDKASRAVEVLADNTGMTSMAYDGASRRIETTDALGNITDVEYDNNNNATRLTTFEKCTISGPQTIPDETFRSAAFYDSLNRLVLSARQGADRRTAAG